MSFLTMMCAYVCIIIGVIIVLFTLQGYKDWINNQYMSNNGIIVGLILCLIGFWVFEYERIIIHSGGNDLNINAHSCMI